MQLRVERSQVGIDYNMRKQAETSSQYVIRLSEEAKAENLLQQTQTANLAAEKKAAMLDEEVKAIIGEAASHAPDPSLQSIAEP